MKICKGICNCIYPAYQYCERSKTIYLDDEEKDTYCFSEEKQMGLMEYNSEVKEAIQFRIDTDKDFKRFWRN